jgi:hypothetical protein
VPSESLAPLAETAREKPCKTPTKWCGLGLDGCRSSYPTRI